MHQPQGLDIQKSAHESRILLYLVILNEILTGKLFNFILIRFNNISDKVL